MAPSTATLASSDSPVEAYAPPSAFQRLSRRLTGAGAGAGARQDSTLTNSSTDSSRSKAKVMVFIRSSDSVDLQARTDVEDQARQTPPLNIVEMPRAIWHSNKDIYVPAKTEHKHDPRKDGDPQKCRQCEFAATIDLNNMGFLFKLKRAMGLVNQIYVFENPFPRIQPVH